MQRNPVFNSPTKRFRREYKMISELVGLGGFEPPTLGLGNPRSIHLSYSPGMAIVIRLSGPSDQRDGSPEAFHSANRVILSPHQ